jgi:hypothetical protein
VTAILHYLVRGNLRERRVPARFVDGERAVWTAASGITRPLRLA